MAPPLETLLTQFRKLQPSPLEVGDHLIIVVLPLFLSLKRYLCLTMAQLKTENSTKRKLCCRDPLLLGVKVEVYGIA